MFQSEGKERVSMGGSPYSERRLSPCSETAAPHALPALEEASQRLVACSVVLRAEENFLDRVGAEVVNTLRIAATNLDFEARVGGDKLERGGFAVRPLSDGVACGLICLGGNHAPAVGQLHVDVAGVPTEADPSSRSRALVDAALKNVCDLVEQKLVVVHEADVDAVAIVTLLRDDRLQLHFERTLKL